ncbi:hypothetical protein RKE25_19505 [Dyella sp. BiH032]|uniref:hypothetical protein n=1 Tax=Dyella sp. BiH032 TaxID=3075430 RepID=UPI0028935845|nr:hypothetical protein [Dyella sp. BiH032]WNL45573.1 hypothetical protein RKE25_19505 [Dyella sp. BiH032]
MSYKQTAMAQRRQRATAKARSLAPFDEATECFPALQNPKIDPAFLFCNATKQRRIT